MSDAAAQQAHQANAHYAALHSRGLWAALGHQKDLGVSMLNTKLNDSLVLDVSLPDALTICRKAVAELGWRVLDQDRTRIRCKEVAVSGMSFNWPAEVEIILSSLSQSQTTVYLNGSVFGLGPKKEKRGQVLKYQY